MSISVGTTAPIRYTSAHDTNYLKMVSPPLVMVPPPPLLSAASRTELGEVVGIQATAGAGIPGDRTHLALGASSSGLDSAEFGQIDPSQRLRVHASQ